jgi:hypothetical protein
LQPEKNQTSGGYFIDGFFKEVKKDLKAKFKEILHGLTEYATILNLLSVLQVIGIQES